MSRGSAVPRGQKEPRGQGPLQVGVDSVAALPNQPAGHGEGDPDQTGQKLPRPHAYSVVLVEPAGQK